MSKKILVIDDEDGVREITQFSLEAVAGWDVTGAASGPEGIERAIAEQPDAILLDVTMPAMDGPTTFRRLQTSPQTAAIPTILLTAQTDILEQQHLLELGITGLITKPFKPQELVQQICALLGWAAL